MTERANRGGGRGGDGVGGEGRQHGAHLFSPPEQWRDLQRRSLVEHLRKAARSPLYDNATLSDIAREIEFSQNFEAAFQKLPFTTKDDLARAANSAWVSPPHEVAEWVCTSGTMGKPLDIPLTAADLDRLAENEAVALSSAGIQKGDLLILAVGMERLFVAGLAYWLGAQKLGATCVRAGPQIAADPQLLSDLLARFPTPNRTFLIAVPSFLTSVDPPPTAIAGIIAIGEPIRQRDLEYNTLGRRLAARFSCPIMSTYALTETCTTFAEGPSCRGGHLNPALAILELSDPNPEGIGEVVITPLGVQGMPLIRFRTGDIATLHTDPCPCGRTTPRLGPILGRKQHLLKVRGTSLYPTAIVETVRAIEGVLDCVVIADRAGTDLSDCVTVCVQLSETAPRDPAMIEKRLQATLRVTPEVRIVTEAEWRSLSTSPTRKTRRFIDRR